MKTNSQIWRSRDLGQAIGTRRPRCHLHPPTHTHTHTTHTRTHTNLSAYYKHQRQITHNNNRIEKDPVSSQPAQLAYLDTIRTNQSLLKEQHGGETGGERRNQKMKEKRQESVFFFFFTWTRIPQTHNEKALRTQISISFTYRHFVVNLSVLRISINQSSLSSHVYEKPPELPTSSWHWRLLAKHQSVLWCKFNNCQVRTTQVCVTLPRDCQWRITHHSVTHHTIFCDVRFHTTPRWCVAQYSVTCRTMICDVFWTPNANIYENDLALTFSFLKSLIPNATPKKGFLWRNCVFSKRSPNRLLVPSHVKRVHPNQILMILVSVCKQDSGYSSQRKRLLNSVSKIALHLVPLHFCIGRCFTDTVGSSGPSSLKLNITFVYIYVYIYLCIYLYVPLVSTDSNMSFSACLLKCHSI